MRQDHHGCLRLFLGGAIGFLTLLATFVILFVIGFRAAPAPVASKVSPDAPVGTVTLTVHEDGRPVSTSEIRDGSLRSRARTVLGANGAEEHRLGLDESGAIDAHATGVFRNGSRVRDLSAAELGALQAHAR